MRRLGDRLGTECGQRARLDTRCHPGAFLIVLRGAGAPVVVSNDHRVPSETNGSDPGAARVPSPSTTAERSGVPRPPQTVNAGRVVADHLVGLSGIFQWMACHPHMPQSTAVHDHRVLDTRLRVARQRDLALPGIEGARIAGLDHLDTPVLAAIGGAAQVQPPLPAGRPQQRRALERLGTHFLLADHCQGLESRTVARMGHRDRVPASLFQGPPEPVGEVNLPTAFYGAWRAGPISRALSWRGDSEYRAIRVWPQGSSHPRE